MDDTALLEEWADYLRATGSSAKSIEDRLITLRAMLRRTGATLLTVTRQMLIKELGRGTSGERRERLKPSTRAHYKSLFHTFFTWLQDEGYRLDNPGARLPSIKVPRTEADPFTTDDLQHLLDSGIYARTRMYVLLYAYQGLRCGEIAAVAGETIDWERRRILSAEGKGGVEVWRPIHPLVWEELQKWPRAGYLFPSHKYPDRHVTANSVSGVLSRAIKRAHVDHHAHQLRAWFGTELVEAGASTIVAAAAMRHGDLQSLSRYVRISDRKIVEAIAKLPRVEVPEQSGRKAA